jgi:hypothetical protein
VNARSRAVGALGFSHSVVIVTSLDGSVANPVAAIKTRQRQFLSTGAIAARADGCPIGTSGLGSGVAVVTHFVLGDVSNAVAAGLVGAAVGTAPIARVHVSIVTDLPLIAVEVAITTKRAAPIWRPTVRWPSIRKPGIRLPCVRNT